ncbi:MAG: type III restriction enzyme, res subunit [Dasosvirus sp.]|uniref:Type III restriction enzyme, res subunit n=1 Tax=Dasosvirus sp. TaxID=2487764 RepID=A0A3G4ZRJ1_9VIRU|nr:MAG: type III restriction enzyme, res subunit [Dasosvirus sp.]
MINVRRTKHEVYDVLKAISDGETDASILNAYEEYTSQMLNFIKTKDKKWFVKFFVLIETEVHGGTTKETLTQELLDVPNINRELLLYLMDSIFGEDLVDSDEENDIDETNIDETNIDETNNTNIPINAIDDIKLDVAIKNFKWRNNQLSMIRKIIEQNFLSGLVAQIMGSGKSFLILHTIDQHYKLYPNKKLYIVTCFRQEILKDMFFDENQEIDPSKVEFLKNNNIINLDQFHVIDRVHHKKKAVKLSKNLPSILVINSDYLKVLDGNEIIDYDDVNLVILDECHSVSANRFYNVLYKIKYTYQKSIIGFSATPLRARSEDKLVNIFSQTFDEDKRDKKLNIISNYDFITAIKDNVILPPRYILCEINKSLNGRIGKDNKEIMKTVLTNTLETVPYRKIIGWCRTIRQMTTYYKFFKEQFPDLQIYCSSCLDKSLKERGYNTNYHEFAKKKQTCILLCVNRCREGSDIMNLDLAIYLDTVKNRCLLVWLQTSGRVLRKDQRGLKKYGTVIDSFVHSNDIQIETLTAHRIISYYKQILSLCDPNDHIEQQEQYNQLIGVFSKMQYDEKKQEIIIKLDDEKEHDLKIKLELKTKTYDFNKMKIEIGDILDKTYHVEKKYKFDQIIEKLKKTNEFSIKTIDFWDQYDMIPMKNKEKLNIPLSSDDLHTEYEEFFDKHSWYQILGLHTSRWYQSINECRNSLSKLNVTKITKKKYLECTKKDNRLPINPKEYFKSKNFTSVEVEFGQIKRKFAGAF